MFRSYTGGGGGGGSQQNGTVDFLGRCSDQQLSSFTLLDRTSFPHYNNTKIIKFGWKLFNFMSDFIWTVIFGICHWWVAPPPKKKMELSIFLGLCSDQQLFFSPC